mmetsp:Transcript_118029/g.359079  ORF Transcript_118029/g.359079 Transcript_118029/m.359079 type:complete len:101 (-) Transcript_118029:4-306(-)
MPAPPWPAALAATGVRVYREAREADMALARQAAAVAAQNGAEVNRLRTLMDLATAAHRESMALGGPLPPPVTTPMPTPEPPLTVGRLVYEAIVNPPAAAR